MIYAVNQTPVLAGFMDNAYSTTLFVEAMGVAVILGMAGGLYPAWRAARLQPVEAMRYDGSAGRSRASAGYLSRIGGLAFRNLLRQRTRALLTTLAIGIGVGLVVALGGMGAGLVEQFSAIGGQAGDLTITEAKASDISMAAIDDKVGRYIATLPGVQSVSGMLLGIASAPGAPYFLAFGLEPTSYAMRHYAITEGERLRSPRELIMGKVAARNFKKRVGDNMLLMGTNYRIVGIYETGVGYEDSSAVMSLQEAQRLFKKPNQVSVYGVKLRDPGQADQVSRQIQARYAQLGVSRSTEFAEKLNDMNSFRAMTNALSLISILVGGVGMMNAMLMSVYERTREIGTLRALGWRRRRVVWMIVREALWLSLLSGLAGIALGIGMGTLLGLEPSMGSYLKGSYSLTLMVQAIAIAVVLGIIGALYPSLRASNLSPIEALRYE
jgi:ABC-type antimicrobial peptide transport system permease subunit